METALRAVFERHKKHIRDKKLTLAHQLTAVLDAEQNTIDAFQRKRKKLRFANESGAQNNPIYVSQYD